MLRRLAKIGTWMMAGLLALLILVYLGLIGGLSTAAVNRLVKTRLKGLVAGEVRFGKVSTNIFSSITLRDFQVLSEQGGVKRPVVVIDKLIVRYRLWALLIKGIDWTDDVQLIRIEGLKVFLLRDQSEQWNVVQLLKPLLAKTRRVPKAAEAEAVPLPVIATKIELVDSVIAIHDQKRDFLSSLNQINGSLDSREASKIHFTLAGRTEEAVKPNLNLSGDVLLDEARVDFQAEMKHVPLAQYLNYLFPQKGIRFTQGSADLLLEARATEHSLDMKGRAGLKGARILLPGVADPLENLEGDVRFSKDRLEFTDLSARFLGSTWRAGGKVDNLLKPQLSLFMENTGLDLTEISRNLSLQALELTGTAQLGVSITGAVKSPLIEGWIRSQAMGAKGMRMEGFATKVRMEGRLVELEQLSARVFGGNLEGRGRVSLPRKNADGTREGGTLDLQMKLADMNLDELSSPGQPYLPFHGLGDVSFDLNGSLAEPRISLVITIPQFSLGAEKLGPLALKTSWYKGDLDFNLAGFEDTLVASGRYKAGRKAEFQKISFSLKNFDIGAMAQGIADAPDRERAPKSIMSAAGMVRRFFNGHLTAEAQLDGPTENPHFTGLISIPDGQVLKAGESREDPRRVALMSTLKGKLEYADGVLRLGKDQEPLELSFSHKKNIVRIYGAGDYEVNVAKPSPNPLNFSMKMEGSMGVLQAYDIFTDSEGSIDANLVVTGNPSSPKIEGRLEIARWKGVMRRYLDSFQDGRITLVFENRRFTVRDFHFKSGGVLEGEGDLILVPDSFPLGRVVLRTDKQGLKIANWDEMGNGSLVLDPLALEYTGGSKPILLSGRVSAHDLTISYGGRAKKPKDAEAGAPAAAPKEQAWPGLALDLNLALGDNVWYESSMGERLAISNLGDFTRSLASFLYRPAFQIQLKPTENDFRISGPLKDLSLSGELAIKRGIVTYQNNDFNIKEGSILFKYVPSGEAGSKRRGDMKAEAELVTKVLDKSSVDASGNKKMKNVTIKLSINPMSEQQLIDNNMQNNFLNYNPSFTSEPAFYSSPEKNTKAIASVLFFGDDLTGESEDALGGGVGLSAGGQAAATDAGSVVGRVLSKYLGSIANFFSRGASNTVGRFLFDYLRVSPGISQGSTAAKTGSTAGTGSPGAAGSQGAPASQDNTLQLNNIQMDAGRNLLPNVFWSMQGLYTVNPALENTTGTLDPNQRIESGFNGLRTGMEYSLGTNRHLEFYWNWGVDDNLEPLPLRAEDSNRSQSISLIARGTVKNQTYGRLAALRRKMEYEAKKAK